jgi:predicted GNAT family N-acyltransferase
MKIVLFKAFEDALRWQQALAIRTRVFMEEQGVPESEEVDAHDEGDASCIHALIEFDGVPAATGRIYESGPEEGRIGRMAVLPEYRGNGNGMALLDVLIKEGRRRRLRSLVLDAQTHAVGFYAKRGFVEQGQTFLDCGIPHQQMRLGLP